MHFIAAFPKTALLYLKPGSTKFVLAQLFFGNAYIRKVTVTLGIGLKALTLHDKNEIEAYLQKNVFLHIYSIGDLDDFFWNYTTWYASKHKGQITAIILLYTGLPLPTLLAFADDIDPVQDLLESVLHFLPRRFYAHLQTGLESVVKRQFRLESHGEHYKMALTHNSSLAQVDASRVSRLSMADLDDIKQLYNLSYPGNWFDPRMLETGQYFGIKEDDEILSIAGIHVYSALYKVAALGNITTHPNHRSRGLGKAVTARLCSSLSKTVDHIGLNVKADNHLAISMYEKLGFEIVSPYGEYTVTSK